MKLFRALKRAVNEEDKAFFLKELTMLGRFTGLHLTT